MRNNKLYKITNRLLILTAFVLLSSTVLTKHLYNILEGKQISYAQSFLFVIQTLTTTGYGELLPFYSWIMNLYASILMMAGLSLIFILLATAAAEWLKDHFEEVPPQKAKGLKDHIILCNYNAITDSVIEELLHCGYPCLVIAKQAEHVRELNHDKVSAIHGDPTERNVLLNAGIMTAKALVALGSDEENMKTVLEARALHKLPIYAFVDESKYNEVLKMAGATREILPKRVLGDELARWALSNFNPNVISDIGEVDSLMIMEFPMGIYRNYIKQSIDDSELEEQTGVTVLGIWENGIFSLLHDKKRVISEESILVVIGQRAELENLSEKMTQKPHHIHGDLDLYIVGGFGEVAKSTIKILKGVGKKTRVIIKETGYGEDFIIGQITSKDVLVQAGIMDAGTYIISVDRDDHALLSILIARSLNPDIRIVARANSHHHVNKMYRAGADFVLSISKVGASFLSRMLTDNKDSQWPGRDTRLWEIEVGDELAGKRLNETYIMDDTSCHVAALIRKGVITAAISDDTSLELGDRIIMIGN